MKTTGIKVKSATAAADTSITFKLLGAIEETTALKSCHFCKKKKMHL